MIIEHNNCKLVVSSSFFYLTINDYYIFQFHTYENLKLTLIVSVKDQVMIKLNSMISDIYKYKNNYNNYGDIFLRKMMSDLKPDYNLIYDGLIFVKRDFENILNIVDILE